MANNEISFRHFLCMFEAKTTEYVQGVCDHFLVPAYKVLFLLNPSLTVRPRKSHIKPIFRSPATSGLQ